MTYTTIELVASILFFIALIHTFATKQFERLSHRFPRHAGVFHLLGEVEVVFGFWAIVLIFFMALFEGGHQALTYAESRQYTEPLFVFVVMVVAASKPILQFVLDAIKFISKLIPIRNTLTSAWLGLAAVPLFGSAITEPAAMTIAALMLAPRVFRSDIPEKAKYFALGVLFVNVSIGGTLSSFAAPPVLMVASTWHWDSMYMLTHFGWKAAIAVVINATIAVFILRKHLQLPNQESTAAGNHRAPFALTLVHLSFLIAVISLAHHPVAFMGLFLMFLGVAQAYERHQNTLIIKEALLVAFFLAGLVVLGGMQQWWLQELVATMSPDILFFGSAALTAVTDNAALTYLGSLISGISEQAKYSLVAGAVAGGGLTMIANAPNPAGVALLKRGFADESIGAGELLVGAAVPTLVAIIAFVGL